MTKLVRYPQTSTISAIIPECLYLAVYLVAFHDLYVFLFQMLRKKGKTSVPESNHLLTFIFKTLRPSVNF